MACSHICGVILIFSRLHFRCVMVHIVNFTPHPPAFPLLVYSICPYFDICTLIQPFQHCFLSFVHPILFYSHFASNFHNIQIANPLFIHQSNRTVRFDCRNSITIIMRLKFPVALNSSKRNFQISIEILYLSENLGIFYGTYKLMHSAHCPYTVYLCSLEYK